MPKWLALFLAVSCIATRLCLAGESTAAATRPATIPSVQIDAKNKQIRVTCEALNAQMPLEFFCVIDGAQEYESVLRTAAKPSTIHFGLLALGLTPGSPARFDQAKNIWYAPTGPPLKISCEFMRDGQLQHVPANRLMRSVKTKKEMPPTTWVFDGSQMLTDGQYAADLTGAVVTIVNFDLTMIDVPELASNANETLEWECNPDACPKKGTKVTMIIEPAVAPAATQPAQTLPAGQYNPGPGLHGGQ